MSDPKRPTVSVIPTMRYRDAPAAIAWLGRAFGFEEHFVVPGDDDTIRHAQLTFGHGMIMLGSAGASPDFDALQRLPVDVGGAGTQSAYVIVDDIDAHHARAVAAGAKVVVPLRDEGHGKGYSCLDPEGHLWNFGDYDPWATDEAN